MGDQPLGVEERLEVVGALAGEPARLERRTDGSRDAQGADELLVNVPGVDRVGLTAKRLDLGQPLGEGLPDELIPLLSAQREVAEPCLREFRTVDDEGGGVGEGRPFTADAELGEVFEPGPVGPNVVAEDLGADPEERQERPDDAIPGRRTLENGAQPVPGGTPFFREGRGLLRNRAMTDRPSLTPWWSSHDLTALRRKAVEEPA